MEEGFEWTLLQKKYTNSKHMKRCSVLLVIREIQIKTTMRHLIKLNRMARIKNLDGKYWQGCGETGASMHY
jgi:hypothetical protein